MLKKERVWRSGLLTVKQYLPDVRIIFNYLTYGMIQLLDWIFLIIGSRDLRMDVSRNNAVG